MTLLETILAAGNVARFHAHTLVRPQSVGAHSANVAMICLMLSETTPSATLLLAALTHDYGEVRTGDIPAPCKWRLSLTALDELGALESEVLDAAGLNDYTMMLTPKEKSILKLADTAECALKCIHERQLGNRTLGEVFRGCVGYMWGAKPEDGDRVYLTLKALEKLWEQANDTEER